MSPLRLPPVCLFALLLAAASTSASAQETVIPVENVRMDYAQVLRVEPVYQTLTATRAEQHCEGDVPTAEAAPAKGLSRIVGKVKQALTPKGKPATPPSPADCRMVQVRREFRRPIAFDVDYMYKGMKYRSRLPEDPGNRLRVRVSVTPYVAPADR
jgi:uncharacterized protein YcfJ